MISDLAPVDLLLQRSGRLHRHTRGCRPEALNTPALWVIEPTLQAQGRADFRESGYIYDRHVLLRSWLALRDRTSIRLPEETDSLIESVYDLEANIPESLESIYQEDWQLSLADYRAETEESHRAKANKVKLPPPRAENNPDQFTRQGEEDDEATIAAVTRLGKPSLTTIFLQRTEEGLCFPTGERHRIELTRPSLAVIRDLLAHSTRISKKDIVKALLAQSNPKEWSSALLRNCRYVELDSDGGVDVGKWRLSLDPFKGVLIQKKDNF
jgi:CRISPR-associated endonuclease/helicase Cas3